MSEPSFDPCRLDWSRHLLPARSELGKGQFLADAARSLGGAIYEGWWGDEPASLRPSDLPPEIRIPEPDVAFDEDGSPVANVHAAFDPAVRIVLGPAAWKEMMLRWTDEAAWDSSHVPDPQGGPPLSKHALESRDGLDADEAITYENWRAAWEELMFDRGSREEAVVRMTRIAYAIAELAISGRIQVRARPLLGGPCDVAVPASIWLTGVEGRMRRLASCGFSTAAPHDPAAESTHLLFVDCDDLEGLIADYGRDNLVCMFPPNEPWTVVDDEVAPLPRSARFGNLEKETDEFIRAILASPDRTNWREPDLMRMAKYRFGRNRVGIVRAIRKRLAAEPSYGFLRDPGQPIKEGRPSLMSEMEFKAFVRTVPQLCDLTGRA